jgi:hypothetical protein
LGQFAVQSAYQVMFLGQSSVLGAKELWEIKALDKCLFFGLQVLLGRCWTSERLQCHGLDSNGPCTICSQEEERLDHLLLSCVYSRELWFLILARVGWSRIAPSATDAFVNWWLLSQKRIAKAHRKGFNSIIILVVRLLWG